MSLSRLSVERKTGKRRRDFFSVLKSVESVITILTQSVNSPANHLFRVKKPDQIDSLSIPPSQLICISFEK